MLKKGDKNTILANTIDRWIKAGKKLGSFFLTHAHYDQFTGREISCAALELGEKVKLILLLSALFFSLSQE